jgi:hypothetical protein
VVLGGVGVGADIVGMYTPGEMEFQQD